MKNKKEILKIILVNFLLIAIILGFGELYFYERTAKQMAHGYYKLPYFNNVDDILATFWSKRFRLQDKNFKSNKAPILLLGCSYAYGMTLDEPDAPSELLKKYSNRWVYNFAIPGADPMYNLLTLEKEAKDRVLSYDKPDTVIYIYIYTIS